MDKRQPAVSFRRAFVTGGSGFVGRNLIATLRSRGVEVHALARSRVAMRAVQAVGAIPIPGDLDDTVALRSGMEGCDVVFHAAAKVDDWGRYADFYRVNVVGTEHVIAAAQAAGVPRLVHVSTEAVLLGGPPIVGVDETRPRPPRPLGLYARTKGRAEEWVLRANTSHFATVVVRPRFVWGAGDTSMLPQIIAAVRAGRYAWIDGGHYLTSTCHVMNLCEGLILAALHGRGGEIYFLTDGPPVELRSFGLALLRSQGIVPGDRSVPWWAVQPLATLVELIWRVFVLPGRPPISRAMVRLIGREVTVDDRKARRELGYQGHMSRDEGLARMSHE